MPPATVLHVLGTAQVEGTSIADVPAMLARLLDPHDFRLHACFLGDDGPLVHRLETAGVTVTQARWVRSGDVSGAVRFARYVRRHSPRIIHVHFGGRAVRWVAARVSRAPLIMHLHGRVREGEPSKLVSMDLADVAAVIANSAATAACVLGKVAEVIHPAVPLPQETADATREDELTVGTAARLVPLKGVAHLIGAVARLSRRFPNMRLEIAGAGPEENSLRKLAIEADIAERVHFLGWCPDVASAARRWQICAQPSIEEALGVSILHAMAAGLPVIATNVGGIPEAVLDGVTGFLVPPADADALADKLAILAAHPELRRQMGSAGRARVAEHFSEAAAATRMTSLYQQVLARRFSRGLHPADAVR